MFRQKALRSPTPSISFKNNMMKRLLLLFALVLCAVQGISAQAVISFEKTTVDLGKFYEKKVQNCEFKFTNTGNKPLVITQAFGSCGCTVPTPPKDPIAPGESAVIKVTYNGKGKFPGYFKKAITVKSNATNNIARIYIQGTMLTED